MTTTDRTDNLSPEDEDILQSASDILRRIKRDRDEQPTRLLQAREQAAEARDECLAIEDERWDGTWTAVPIVDDTGEMNGLYAMPSIDGKELFGTRLAFDLLGCSAADDQVDETMENYFGMVREPAHMFLVCAAALKVIAKHVVPQMLDDLEQHASNYNARVLLADAARNAWTTRVNDVRQGGDHD